MNFTRPINASIIEEKNGRSDQTISVDSHDKQERWKRFWQWLKVFFKWFSLSLLVLVILAGILLPFAPYFLSTQWGKPICMKLLMPNFGDDITVDYESSDLSWGEGQILRNVRFVQKKPTETREIFLREVVIKNSLWSLAPWNDTYALTVDFNGAEVVRTPLEERYKYHFEGRKKPSKLSLSLQAKITDLHVYPFGRNDTSLHLATAEAGFESLSKPLTFAGQGEMHDGTNAVVGDVDLSLHLRSFNHLRTFSLDTAKVLPLETLQLKFKNETLAFDCHIVGEENDLVPKIKVQGTAPLVYWFERFQNHFEIANDLQVLAGQTSWTLSDIMLTPDAATFKLDFACGTKDAPLQLLVNQQPFTTTFSGGAQLEIPFQSPQVITIASLSLMNDWGLLNAIATIKPEEKTIFFPSLSVTSLWGALHTVLSITPESMTSEGVMTADLATLWKLPIMDGLRAEGVKIEGFGIYPFTYQGPLTFDYKDIFQTAKASLVLVCDKLILPEKELPNITFQLDLMDAMLHCKGDFMVRGRPFQLMLPMAEVFGTPPLNSNTLRAYFPQIKGTP